MISSEASLLACGWPAPCHVSSHGLSTVCTHPCCLSCVLISSDKDTSQIGQGSPERPHFNLLTSLRVLSPNSHILRYYLLGLQHLNFRGGGHNSVHNTEPSHTFPVIINPLQNPIAPVYLAALTCTISALILSYHICLSPLVVCGFLEDRSNVLFNFISPCSSTE